MLTQSLVRSNGIRGTFVRVLSMRVRVSGRVGPSLEGFARVHRRAECRAAEPLRRSGLCPATADPFPTKDRPFDPDELPIEAHQTDEEREFTSTLPPRAYAPGGIDLAAERAAAAGMTGSTSARSFSLRAIAGRLLRS